MILSIIIPSYNAQKNINACLHSIEKQKDDQLEVIVVDCSPHDQVMRICNQYNFVKYIKVEKRFNPGEGRNIGAKLSVSDYLVFIDSDVVLANNAIINIRDSIYSGKEVFGAALEINKTINDSFSGRVEHYYFNHESQSSRQIKKRNNLSSAFMIIKKELFLKFNGFSDIPRMQDTELTERLAESGIDLYFVPDIIGYQIQDSPIKSVLNKIKITGNNLFFIRYSKKINTKFKRLYFSLLLPLMMIAKITRINFRNIRYSFSFSMLFIYSPFMYVCGFYWMLGFYRALFISDGIATGR